MDETPASELPQPRGPRIAKALLWIGTIWLIGWIGMILSDAISWSNPLQGAASGAIQGLILSPFLLIFTLPAALLGRVIGTWRPLREWRLAISLLFAAMFPLWEVGSALVDRIQPGRRFAKLTAVEFPKDAKIVSCEFQGGGFADLTYTYVFTCSQKETERLIHELKLTKNRDGQSSMSWSAGSGSMVGGSGGWKVEEAWSYERDFDSDPPARGGPHFIELQTDATRTKVRLICGTI